MSSSNSPIVEFDHKAFLRGLTSRPGVYRMLDSQAKVLYVGKAKNLKNRVSSYFRASGLTTRTLAMVGKVANIEITITNSETEALLLDFFFCHKRYEWIWYNLNSGKPMILSSSAL